MRAPRFWVLALALAAVALVGGCGGAPYIHKENEFDRSRSDFNQEPQDIKALTICYSGLDTSTGAVAEMAQARCAEFGKTAVFESDDMTSCPMLTPTAANFRCVK
ncbi:MAG: hypothetical protein ACYYKD_10040 [Rhodospirillales bacterium]